MIKIPEGKENIFRTFLNQCAPHMRGRDWYQLLERATQTLEAISEIEPQPANTLAWWGVIEARKALTRECVAKLKQGEGG